MHIYKVQEIIGIHSVKHMKDSLRKIDQALLSTYL